MTMEATCTSVWTLATALYVKIDDELQRSPQVGGARAEDRHRAEADRRGADHRGGLQAVLAIDTALWSDDVWIVGRRELRFADPIERTRAMRKLIVSTFLTLDGVMQAPGGPGEDDSGGFTHGGWSVNYWDEQMGQVMSEAMSTPFALVLGRKTYDIFAAYWPHAPEEAGARPLNDATKYVASRSHPSLEWSNSVLIEALLRHNLVDEYRLWVFPLVIGSGKRLFAEGTIASGLRLVDSKVSTTGVVIGTYEPAGEIVPGSFALE